MKTSLEKIKVINRQGNLKNGLRIKIASDFDIPRDIFWERIQNVSSLIEICKPLISFKSYSGNLPYRWDVLKTYHFKLSMYQFFPALKHSICIKSIDKSSYEVISEEYNKLITVWNHTIKMKELDKNKTHYIDIVDIHAGILTYVVALWSIRFYMHRQKKWIKLLLKGSSEN